MVEIVHREGFGIFIKPTTRTIRYTRTSPRKKKKCAAGAPPFERPAAPTYVLVERPAQREHTHTACTCCRAYIEPSSGRCAATWYEVGGPRPRQTKTRRFYATSVPEWLCCGVCLYHYGRQYKDLNDPYIYGQRGTVCFLVFFRAVFWVLVHHCSASPSVLRGTQLFNCHQKLISFTFFYFPPYPVYSLRPSFLSLPPTYYTMGKS